MSNDLTVKKNEQIALINSFFGDIDFKQLNTTIEKLANHGPMTDVEKESAMEVIDIWNENVINKLTLEKTRIMDFLSCINSCNNWNNSRAYRENISSIIKDQSCIEELEAIIDYLDIRYLYEELILAMHEYNLAYNALQEIRDKEIVIDVNTTREEELILYKDNEIENIKLNADLKRAGNKVIKLNCDISNAILKDEEMKKLINKLKKKVKVMNNMQLECTDKSQMAKINITIDDESAREALTELINFKL